MAALPPPKSPSSLVKVGRWTLLSLGIVYGHKRHNVLKCIEEERRCIEERERPAKEAAAKAERERKNKEEMAYLAIQAGIGTGDAGGDGKCPGGSKRVPKPEAPASQPGSSS